MSKKVLRLFCLLSSVSFFMVLTGCSHQSEHQTKSNFTTTTKTSHSEKKTQKSSSNSSSSNKGTKTSYEKDNQNPSSSVNKSSEQATNTQAPSQTETTQPLVQMNSQLPSQYLAILNTYRKWIGVLSQGGTFEDPTVEENYLKNCVPDISLFSYCLYDINGDGQNELLLATKGSTSYFIFSIWSNETYPVRISSSDNVRRYTSVFKNGIVSQYYLNGFSPINDGNLYRMNPNTSLLEEVGSFTYNIEDDSYASNGPELYPDQAPVNNQLPWQPF